MNWEYIAGFFDGEGNLQMHPIRKDGKIRAYQLLTRIYSTNKEVIEKIKDFLGGKGHIYIKKASKNNPDRNIVYEFVIAKKEDSLFFLKNIIPYSVIKRDQINYLLTNFDFSVGHISRRGHTNITFDLDKFRSFTTRKNTDKFIKTHTIKALTE